MASDHGFTLLTRHPDFVLLNKAPGVNFHSEAGDPGLVARAEAQLGQPLWPVHRLDKMTSGLLLLARSQDAAAEFGRLFEARAVEKFYLAIGRGKPRKKQGAVIGDMTRSRRRGWKLLHSCEQPAITQFFSRACGVGHRLFLLRPHTGKTHQLRVALASLGAPVAGDDIYAAGSAGEYDRGYLHAYALAFPWRGERCEYVCSPDAGARFTDAVFTEAVSPLLPPACLPWPALSVSRTVGGAL